MEYVVVVAFGAFLWFQVCLSRAMRERSVARDAFTKRIIAGDGHALDQLNNLHRVDLFVHAWYACTFRDPWMLYTQEPELD